MKGTTVYFLLLQLMLFYLVQDACSLEELEGQDQDEDDETLVTNSEEEKIVEAKQNLRSKGKKLVGILRALRTNNSAEAKSERVKDMRYLLRSHEHDAWVTLKTDGSDADLVWNKGGKVKVIMHGWTPMTWKDSLDIIKDQFDIGIAFGNLEDNINAIVVDWTCLSKEPPTKYFHAAKSTPWAGEAVGTFLMKLAEKGLITDWKDVHLIGFSLGGHVAAVAGYTILSGTQQKVGRITGLDPAGPSFDHNGKLAPDHTKVLDKEDAEFVDIIHCNMGSLIKAGENVGGRFGSTVQAGHADFYPNGGSRQPGCTNIAEAKGCSHTVCNELFKNSITKPMPACPCDSWEEFQKGSCKCTEEDGGVLMGNPCPTSATGRYYIAVDRTGVML